MQAKTGLQVFVILKPAPTVFVVVLQSTLNMSGLDLPSFSYFFLSLRPLPFFREMTAKYYTLHSSKQAFLNTMCHWLALHGIETLGFYESEFAG